MKTDKVLVTGSRGFVGKHLCRRLGEIGISPDNQRGRVDITDTTSLKSLQKVELIVHLAAKTSINDSLVDPYGTFLNNLLGTLNLLEYARLEGVKKFIYVSTYIYGKPEYLPIDEKHPVNPHTPYNKSKLMAEELCKNYSDDFGIDVVVLRPFLIYGPGDRTDSFISRVFEQIKRSGIVMLSGENTKRDVLFISDFIELLFRIFDAFPIGYNVYNVGFGVSHSLEEITRKIANLLEMKPTISYETTIRPVDINDTKADISKVSKKFNWMPSVSLEHGLKSYIQS